MIDFKALKFEELIFSERFNGREPLTCLPPLFNSSVGYSQREKQNKMREPKFF